MDDLRAEVWRWRSHQCPGLRAGNRVGRDLSVRVACWPGHARTSAERVVTTGPLADGARLCHLFACGQHLLGHDLGRGRLGQGVGRCPGDAEDISALLTGHCGEHHHRLAGDDLVQGQDVAAAAASVKPDSHR